MYIANSQPIRFDFLVRRFAQRLLLPYKQALLVPYEENFSLNIEEFFSIQRDFFSMCRRISLFMKRIPLNWLYLQHHFLYLQHDRAVMTQDFLSYTRISPCIHGDFSLHTWRFLLVSTQIDKDFYPIRFDFLVKHRFFSISRKISSQMQYY